MKIIRNILEKLYSYRKIILGSRRKKIEAKIISLGKEREDLRIQSPDIWDDKQLDNQLATKRGYEKLAKINAKLEKTEESIKILQNV